MPWFAFSLWNCFAFLVQLPDETLGTTPVSFLEETLKSEKRPRREEVEVADFFYLSYQQ